MNQRDGVSTGEQSHPGRDLESGRVGSWRSSRVEAARGGGAAGSACGRSSEHRGGEGRGLLALQVRGRPWEALQQRS